MSLDIETALRVFLASAPQTVHEIETLEFSHSAMAKVYRLWREPYVGEITLEDDSTVAVECANFKPKVAGTEAHLDQRFEIPLDLVDIDDEFREQLDLIPIGTTERIQCVYRVYMSDDLTAIVSGPAVLQVESVSFNKGAATIIAGSPRLNILRTGELYAPRFVPMLRGFI